MINLETKDQKKELLNLIALGAFLWYFIKGVSAFVFMSVNSIGIITEINPSLLFWGNQFFTIITAGLVLYIILKKVRIQIINRTFSIKRTLIFLIIAIVITHLIQFFQGFYISDILFDKFENSAIAYSHIVKYIDRFGLVSLGFNVIESITLLTIFIKWK
jgi:hypothetical protein